MAQPNIFILFTPEDNDIQRQLLHHLNAFVSEFNASLWNDDPILKNEPWKPQIASRLQEADIFLFLLSNTFMYSQFMQQIEFKEIIDRYKVGEHQVIPVILDECPWDTNFESDEYNFSFTELTVLPKGAKPLRDWQDSAEAYNQIKEYLQHILISTIQSGNEDTPKEEVEIKEVAVFEEDQIAIDFPGEKEIEEQARKRKEEAEATARVEEEKKRLAERETKSIEEEKRHQEEESRRKAEGQRLKEVETKKRVQAQLRQEAEAAAKLKEEERRQEDEARKVAKEAKRQEEAEINKKLAEAERNAQQENQQKRHKHNVITDAVSEPDRNTNGKRSIVLGVLFSIFMVYGIWFFSRDSEELPSTSENNKTTKIIDSVAPEKAKVIPKEKKKPLQKLAIGDQFRGGIIFEIDANGESGKIVHIEDEGPMPWNAAMKIHEKLGEGWRLPTFDELKTLYITVGQGGDNSAEFADKLYWSATLYDNYQARLLQFRTGNTSYHYNRMVENRKFLVRAVKEFKR